MFEIEFTFSYKLSEFPLILSLISLSIPLQVGLHGLLTKTISLPQTKKYNELRGFAEQFGVTERFEDHIRSSQMLDDEMK